MFFIGFIHLVNIYIYIFLQTKAIRFYTPLKIKKKKNVKEMFLSNFFLPFYNFKQPLLYLTLQELPENVLDFLRKCLTFLPSKR